MRRHKMSRRANRKNFKRTASRVNKRNLYRTFSRGGIRL